MYCVKCGKEIKEGWVKCPFCGQEVAENAAILHRESQVYESNNVEVLKDTGNLPNKKKKMSDKVLDKALNKVTGRDMETVRISYKELADMIDKYFIQIASSEEELNRIEKNCSKSKFDTVFGTTKEVESKDGKYKIYFHAERANITNVGALSSNTAWIHDMEADKYYQLQKASELKKLSKEIKRLIDERKIFLNFSVNSYVEEEDETDTVLVKSEEAVVLDSETIRQEEEDKQNSAESEIVSAAKPDYAELIELKKLLDIGIITEEEFSTKKKEILGL